MKPTTIAKPRQGCHTHPERPEKCPSSAPLIKSGPHPNPVAVRPGHVPQNIKMRCMLQAIMILRMMTLHNLRNHRIMWPTILQLLTQMYLQALHLRSLSPALMSRVLLRRILRKQVHKQPSSSGEYSPQHIAGGNVKPIRTPLLNGGSMKKNPMMLFVKIVLAHGESTSIHTTSLFIGGTRTPKNGSLYHDVQYDVVVLAQESPPHGGAQYCRAALWGWCWRHHVKGAQTRPSGDVSNEGGTAGPGPANAAAFHHSVVLGVT